MKIEHYYYVEDAKFVYLLTKNDFEAYLKILEDLKERELKRLNEYKVAKDFPTNSNQDLVNILEKQSTKP